jgi:RNA polymerase sigma-70 factor (sigma-E family)
MKEVHMPQSSRDTEFTAFVQTHRVEFLRAARLLTAGDTHLAEDLVQTALARVYVAWAKMRKTGAPVAYVHRIIINAHIDETRRPRWRRERSVSEPPEPTSSGFFTDAGGEAVRAALAQLPPRMRAAVVLRHWLDYSVQDSADLLDCTEGTVKSQTAKGVAKLRELLGGSGFGGIDPDLDGKVLYGPAVRPNLEPFPTHERSTR